MYFRILKLDIYIKFKPKLYIILEYLKLYLICKIKKKPRMKFTFLLTLFKINLFCNRKSIGNKIIPRKTQNKDITMKT